MRWVVVLSVVLAAALASWAPVALAADGGGLASPPPVGLVPTVHGPALPVSRSPRPVCCVPARRGPIEVREEFTLAAPRLTLPATSPDPLAAGEFRVRVAVNRGSDFAINGVSTDRTVVEKWIVDDEHQTTDIGLRYGLRPDLDVGVRIPIQWRGGGFMDQIIDDFHEIFGLPDNARPDYSKDAYDVRLRTSDGVLRSWADRGTGLGNVEVEAHWAFLRRCDDCGWSAALVGRVGLPTATGPFQTDSVDLGLQVVVAKQIAHRLDFYGGLGGTWFTSTEVDGLEYEPLRLHGFLGAEVRIGWPLSLYVEFSGASRLISNVPSYPWSQFYVNAGLKLQIAPCWVLEAGFTEGLFHQQATVDFGAFAGVTVSF